MEWDKAGEATSSPPSTVLSLTAATNSFTISGWTHICVVYNSNLLSLYINGELVATGLKSAYTVHPGVGTPNATTKMINRFEGDIAGLTVLSSALSAVDVTAIFSKGLPAPTSPYSATLLSANQILLRQNGKYVFSSMLFNQTVSAKSVTSMPINSSWTVGFLAERMPPERGGISITLKSL